MLQPWRYSLAGLILIAIVPASWSNPSLAQTPSTVSVATLQVSDNAWRHFNRARAAALRGRTAESERESFRAIAVSPRFAEAYLQLAETQIGDHQYEAALANILAARRFDPSARWSDILMASADNGLERFADALAKLTAMEGTDSVCWQADYERARAETGLANVPAALRWSESALLAAPEGFTDAQLVRANALLLARRWNDAIAQLNQYLQSAKPQTHRQQVLAALEAAQQNLAADQTSTSARR